MDNISYSQIHESMECPICGKTLIESRIDNTVACPDFNCGFNQLESLHCPICGKQLIELVPYEETLEVNANRVVCPDSKCTFNLRNGEPCDHRGCLSHLSHPCERCRRIGGVRVLTPIIKNRLL